MKHEKLSGDSPRPQFKYLPDLIEVRALARWDGSGAAAARMYEIWQRISRIVEGLQLAELREAEAPHPRESHLEAAKRLRPAIFDGLNALMNDCDEPVGDSAAPSQPDPTLSKQAAFRIEAEHRGSEVVYFDEFAGGGELSKSEQNTDCVASQGARPNAPPLRNEPPAICENCEVKPAIEETDDMVKLCRECFEETRMSEAEAAPSQPDIIEEMAELVKTHARNGGCAEEDCGCPGSQLSNLVEKLRVEFREAAPSVQPEPKET